RRRARDQSACRRGTDAGRRRPGDRRGARGGDRLRRERSGPHRHPDGLRPPARRDCPRDRGRELRLAVDTQPARAQGHGRRLGRDAVWTEDRIFHAANMLDPLMLLASAAACTRRIQLGTAVLVLTLRHAAVLARQVSTLHHLSGGRLALGISLGGRPEEYLGLAVPMKRRVAVFRESVTVLRRLLAGQPVDHTGEVFCLEHEAGRPAAPIPLYVGGHAEGALRRAGELADGWIMGPFGTVRDFPGAWRIVRDAARAAGRDADRLAAGRPLYVAVDQADRKR